jgi:hypothetical protein
LNNAFSGENFATSARSSSLYVNVILYHIIRVQGSKDSVRETGGSSA